MFNLILENPFLSLAVSLIGLLVYQFVIKLYVLRAKLPPGPFPVPILGNLLSFRGIQKNVNFIMQDLAKQYGDPCTIFTGSTPLVILSSPETIRENLIENPHDIQSRPTLGHISLFSRGSQDIVVAPYNDLWKLHKKIAARSIKRIIESEHLSEHVASVVDETVEILLAETGPVKLKEYTSCITFSVLMHFCYGKSMSFGDACFRDRLTAQENLNDVLSANMIAFSSQPWTWNIFKYCSFIPAIRKVQDVFNEIHAFNDVQMLEHRNKFSPENPVVDIVDAVLLEQHLMQQSGESFEKMNDVQVGLLLLDIFFAGTDTTSTALRWFFLEMVLNPEVQRKCQEQIDSVIGTRNPTLADRKSLSYIEACIVENLRLHPPAPFSVPHTASRAGVTLGKQYDLPENVLVMSNILGMQYNEKYFPDPKKFNPDRFIGPGGILKPPTWMPFGCGKRVCLGEQLAKNDLFLIITGLLQRMKFGKVPGEIYDAEPTIDGAFFIPRKNYEFTVEDRKK